MRGFFVLTFLNAVKFKISLKNWYKITLENAQNLNFCGIDPKTPQMPFQLFIALYLN
jgi:hypothetical protein